GDVELVLAAKDAGIDEDDAEKQHRAERQHDLHEGNKTAVAALDRAVGDGARRRETAGARHGAPSRRPGSFRFVAGALAHACLLHFHTGRKTRRRASAPQRMASMRGSSIMRQRTDPAPERAAQWAKISSSAQPARSSAARTGRKAKQALASS